MHRTNRTPTGIAGGTPHEYRRAWIVRLSLAVAIALGALLGLSRANLWREHLTCTESTGAVHAFEYNTWLARLGETSVTQTHPKMVAEAKFGRRYIRVTFTDEAGHGRLYFIDRVSGFFSVYDPDGGDAALAVGVCKNAG